MILFLAMGQWDFKRASVAATVDLLRQCRVKRCIGIFSILEFTALWRGEPWREIAFCESSFICQTPDHIQMSPMPAAHAFLANYFFTSLFLLMTCSQLLEFSFQLRLMLVLIQLLPSSFTWYYNDKCKFTRLLLFFLFHYIIHNPTLIGI